MMMMFCGSSWKHIHEFLTSPRTPQKAELFYWSLNLLASQTVYAQPLIFPVHPAQCHCCLSIFMLRYHKRYDCCNTVILSFPDIFPCSPVLPLSTLECFSRLLQPSLNLTPGPSRNSLDSINPGISDFLLVWALFQNVKSWLRTQNTSFLNFSIHIMLSGRYYLEGLVCKMNESSRKPCPI